MLDLYTEIEDKYLQFRDLFESKIENNLNKLVNGEPDFTTDALSRVNDATL